MRAIARWCLVVGALFFSATPSFSDGLGGYFGQPKLYCNSSEELATELSLHKKTSDDGLLTNGCGLLPAHTRVLIPRQEAAEVPGNDSVLIYRVEIIRSGKAEHIGYIAFPANTMDKDSD